MRKTKHTSWESAVWANEHCWCAHHHCYLYAVWHRLMMTMKMIKKIDVWPDFAVRKNKQANKQMIKLIDLRLKVIIAQRFACQPSQMCASKMMTLLKESSEIFNARVSHLLLLCEFCFFVRICPHTVMWRCTINIISN